MIEVLHEDHTEPEITDADEYKFNLDSKLRQIRKLTQLIKSNKTSDLQVQSTMNANAGCYVPILNTCNTNISAVYSLNTSKSIPLEENHTENQSRNFSGQNVQSYNSQEDCSVIPPLSKPPSILNASTTAYGATVYLCNHHKSFLVIGKNRVAMFKQLTLPQLELMAALIGARLADHVKSALQIEDITFWSDSQIVLQWLSTSKQLKRFIRNRVTEIRKLTNTQEWRHCTTEDNPADLLTKDSACHILKITHYGSTDPNGSAINQNGGRGSQMTQQCYLPVQI
ncbi:unnamed protein product [Mytilus coruscus]|uniref:Uncharacterized protein n=1 Tax=Mytilus coruscus TaxID=42192 RepID=A0A6J8EVD9_MYTCO|nr:unnamed protein product [Mytilus coruscus]